MKKVAICDIDGTLTDFLGPFNSFIKEKYDIEIKYNGPVTDFKSYYGKQLKLDWDNLLSDYYLGGYDLAQVPYPGSIEFLDKIQSVYKVLIVTARPRLKNVESQTKTWLKSVDCNYSNLVFSDDKGGIALFYGAAFIIDDNPTYKLSGVRKLFLKDAWYNKGTEGNNVTRFKKYKELENYV